ncbi:MAG: hypothetical protein ACRCW2_15260 [Cellulosilyticaceae bacterium]
MRHEIKKVARMTDELTSFFLEHGAQDVKIHIQNQPRKEVIIVEAEPIRDMEATIERMRAHLSYPRECEMEEYYWELAGGDVEGEDELGLVGNMIDDARIEYDEAHIRVELMRKK